MTLSPNIDAPTGIFTDSESNIILWSDLRSVELTRGGRGLLRISDEVRPDHSSDERGSVSEGDFTVADQQAPGRLRFVAVSVSSDSEGEVLARPIAPDTVRQAAQGVLSEVLADVVGDLFETINGTNIDDLAGPQLGPPRFDPRLREIPRDENVDVRQAAVLFLADPDVREVAVFPVDRRSERVPSLGEVSVLVVGVPRSRRRIQRESQQAAHIRPLVGDTLDFFDEVHPHSEAATEAIP